MSLSLVNSTLSSLKTCQTDNNTAMDIVTDAALNLAETEDAIPGDGEDIQKLEQLVIDCARVDREIACFVEVVEKITAQVRQQPPEAMFGVKETVKNQFDELKSSFSDGELQKHAKVVAFRENLRSSLQPSNPESAEEQLDEDIAVTQSQVIFTCPLTQEEMVNPVKNKKCNHHYEQDAALSMIRNKQNQKKKFRCPVIGCGNTDVKQSDLVLDAAMKRMILIQKRQGGRT